MSHSVSNQDRYMLLLYGFINRLNEAKEHDTMYLQWGTKYPIEFKETKNGYTFQFKMRYDQSYKRGTPPRTVKTVKLWFHTEPGKNACVCYRITGLMKSQFKYLLGKTLYD